MCKLYKCVYIGNNKNITLNKIYPTIELGDSYLTESNSIQITDDYGIKNKYNIICDDINGNRINWFKPIDKIRNDIIDEILL